MSRSKREAGAACALLGLFSAEALTIASTLSRGTRSDTDVVASRLLVGRAWRDVRAGTNITDSLRAQHNHRLDATSSARRDPAGEKRDAGQEQGDTREGDRIGSAHAVEQALHRARAAEGNE